MCGIAGLVGFDAKTPDLAVTARRMADTLAHRGPDDAGIWVDETARVALAHRRLSILDLSPAGHQPMVSACGRFVIAFNGEIYNHLELREELAGAAWRGHSDTETLLAAIAAWGVAKAVKRCEGMFAFALWDRELRTVSLARDRLGEKPLYYGRLGRSYVFASELKALRAHPAWHGDIDRGALALLLRHCYVPAPYSIYRNVSKLPPGTILTLDSDGTSSETPYWSAAAIATAGVAEPFRGTDHEAVETLDHLLADAVGRQMMADVPLGAFLSGGIDSSTVVALMQAQSARPVKTFTIGFHEDGYDESVHARAVARHLGTDHTELYVTPREAMEIIPRLPTLYDEPFADSSQIPTFLVSGLARRHVTVSLSGDGGDELFGGYNRYFIGRSLWRKIGWIPLPLRAGAAAAIEALPPGAWNTILPAFLRLLPRRYRYANPGEKLHRLAEILAALGPDEIYRGLASHWRDPDAVVIGAIEPATALTDPNILRISSDFTERMMFRDLISYLPDDILVKVDRAAMGVSLETRVPMLDRRVVEFAWRLPLSMKVRGGEGKWLLRKVLDKYVPRCLIDRPKMGFGVPIDVWLRGPLRDWAESLLDETRLRREGFFAPALLRAKWSEHLEGKRNWQYHLWDVLMFQAWYEQVSAEHNRVNIAAY